MPSNLSTIGLVLPDDEAFMETITKLAGEAVERLACIPGDYAIWRSQTGAEVWFHVEGERGVIGRLEDGEVIGFTPYFEARQTLPATLTASHKRPGENDFEGAFTARLVEGSAGSPPLDVVFDAVDYAAHDTRPLPLTTRLKLIAFARSVTAVSGEPGPGELRSVARSAAPDAEPPTAHAIVRGTVLEHEVLENEETGATFHWLRMAAGPVSIEVLADPATISGPVAPDSHAVVTCSLFGRSLD
jgi:hypothetical protein